MIQKQPEIVMEYALSNPRVHREFEIEKTSVINMKNIARNFKSKEAKSVQIVNKMNEVINNLQSECSKIEAIAKRSKLNQKITGEVRALQKQLGESDVNFRLLAKVRSKAMQNPQGFEKMNQIQTVENMFGRSFSVDPETGKIRESRIEVLKGLASEANNAQGEGDASAGQENKEQILWYLDGREGKKLAHKYGLDKPKKLPKRYQNPQYGLLTKDSLFLQTIGLVTNDPPAESALPNDPSAFRTAGEGVLNQITTAQSLPGQENVQQVQNGTGD